MEMSSLHDGVIKHCKGDLKSLQEYFEEYHLILNQTPQFIKIAIQVTCQIGNFEGFLFIVTRYPHHLATVNWDLGLRVVSRLGHFEFAKYFINRGTPVTHGALIRALWHDHDDLFMYLLDFIEAAPSKDWRPIFAHVCCRGKVNLLDLLVKKNISMQPLEWRRLVCTCNNHEVLEIILAHCEDRVDALNHGLRTLSVHPISHIKLLIEHGATAFSHIKAYRIFELLDIGLNPKYFESDDNTVAHQEFRRLRENREMRMAEIKQCTSLHTSVINILLDYVGYS